MLGKRVDFVSFIQWRAFVVKNQLYRLHIIAQLSFSTGDLMANFVCGLNIGARHVGKAGIC